MSWNYCPGQKALVILFFLLLQVCFYVDMTSLFISQIDWRLQEIVRNTIFYNNNKSREQ